MAQYDNHVSRNIPLAKRITGERHFGFREHKGLKGFFLVDRCIVFVLCLFINCRQSLTPVQYLGL